MHALSALFTKQEFWKDRQKEDFGTGVWDMKTDRLLADRAF